MDSQSTFASTFLEDILVLSFATASAVMLYSFIGWIASVMSNPVL